MGKSDESLVLRCLEGDSRAFGGLVDRYEKVLFNVAFRVVGRREDAEDVVQSAFLKAYKHLEQFNPTYRFYSWLYRIVMNEALNAAKRYRPATTDLMFVESSDGLPERELEKGATTTLVDGALGMLSPEDRAIILLKHFEGFSYEEISFIFDISVKTVKSRLYTARQRLKDALVASGYQA